MGVALRVWGDRACFTRPECKVERYSYPVITPSAARGILEAIHWKPEMSRWIIERIHVLKLGSYDSVKRNELTMDTTKQKKGLPIQRSTTFLKDVEYVIEARVDSIDPQLVGKHLGIFRQRASKGQCFQRPYLGCREFTADFELLEYPAVRYGELGNRDFGLMFFDFDRSEVGVPRAKFYCAAMVEGIIVIPHPDSEEIKC